MADICRGKGISTIVKMLEDIDPTKEGQFNLLTSFELFEHLYNPRHFLNTVHDLLVPNGFFVFTTLNGKGFDIQLLWRDSKSIAPPHHLNFFNPNSLHNLIEATGFEVVEIETLGRLDFDIVEGMYVNENIRLDRFWKNVINNATEKAKTELQEWISSNKFSSHMRVIAKKI